MLTQCGSRPSVTHGLRRASDEAFFFLSLYGYVSCLKHLNYTVMIKRFVVPAVVALLAIASCASNGNKNVEQEAARTKAEVVADSLGNIVKVGDFAPDFTCTLTDGKQVTLSDLKGKVVMLQFTASWCGVCRKEMPFIEKDIWQRHKEDPNFVLMGIDRDEPLETVLKFAETTGVTYPLALDPGADIFAKYALRDAGITRNVLIDKEGKIVMLTRLYKEDEFAQLVARIDSMLQ